MKKINAVGEPMNGCDFDGNFSFIYTIALIHKNRLYLLIHFRYVRPLSNGCYCWANDSVSLHLPILVSLCIHPFLCVHPSSFILHFSRSYDIFACACGTANVRLLLICIHCEMSNCGLCKIFREFALEIFNSSESVNWLLLLLPFRFIVLAPNIFTRT